MNSPKYPLSLASRASCAACSKKIIKYILQQQLFNRYINSRKFLNFSEFNLSIEFCTMALPQARQTSGHKSTNHANFVKQMVMFGLLMVLVMFCANHKVNHERDGYVSKDVDKAFQICKIVITYFAIFCGLAVVVAVLIHFLAEPITEQQKYYRKKRSDSVSAGTRLPSPDILMARKSSAALSYRNCAEMKYSVFKYLCPAGRKLF